MVAPEQWTHPYHFPCGCKSESICGPKHTRKVLSYRKLQQPCDHLMLFALRDNNSLQQANRKLERKVKEMKMQTDEEHINLQSQRDQVDFYHKEKAIKQSGAADLWLINLTFVNSAADSEAEDGEEADGRGGGGDRAPGTR